MPPEWSDRTFARYYRAWRIFAELGGEGEGRAAVAASIRPRGGFNVAEYTRLADGVLMRFVEANE